MKFEKPKNNSTIEETISKIKKAEAEKEVENTVVESEKEAVAEAIKDEMSDYDENETKATIEELEINPEEKERKKAKERLLKYSKEIYKIGKDYEMVYSHFEPKGEEGRDFNEEINLFLEKRKDDSGYSPTFTYPEIDKLDIRELNDNITDLENTEKNVENEINESVKNIVLEMIAVVKAKINILVEIKEGNPEKAFENAKIAYGDIDDQLCKKAKECYEKKIEFLKEKREKGVVKSDLEKELEENKFNAEDIKKYFDQALDKGNLRYNNLEVIIDEEATAIDVRPSDPNYDYPVIVIPPKREVNGIKLVQLITHEIICHVAQNKSNYELGLEGLSFGKDWETVQEGFAMRGEAGIKKEMLGESYSDFEIQSGSYYILAMEKIKEGVDIREVYDYIFNLKNEEFLAKGDDEEKSEEKASKGAKITLRRVTRGMYPYYFPKDKAYLEGEFMALEIEKEGVDKYLRQSRVDPVFVPDMIKAGVYSEYYTHKKGYKMAMDIAKQILKDRQFINEDMFGLKRNE
jgi:hypothetical protein